jgi:hypothetical protein
MRKVMVAVTSITFGTLFLLPVASAEAAVALGRAGCAPNYSRCQQTCKDLSVGGRRYGEGLWSASQSKSCFQGCSAEQTKCQIEVSRSGTATQNKRPVVRP